MMDRGSDARLPHVASTDANAVLTPRQRLRLARPQPLDTSALEPLESIKVTLSFTWLRAGSLSLDDAGLPSFPALPRETGLYRFDFGRDDEGVRTIYIGESLSLRQRASNYRNAKTDRSRQRTSRRIHKEVVAHLNAGGAIEFAIATAVECGSPVSAAVQRSSGSSCSLPKKNMSWLGFAPPRLSADRASLSAGRT
jgi:hypothetical protein